MISDIIYNIGAFIKLAFHKHINYGKKLRIDFSVKIKAGNKSLITIGDGCSMRNNCYICATEKSKITIGKECFFNRNCMIVSKDNITIGDHCIFGPNICIYDHDHKFSSNGVSNLFKTKEIIIGPGCWIGAGCIVLKGTHIGKNCVIGAGSIISGVIPDASIVRSTRQLNIKPID